MNVEIGAEVAIFPKKGKHKWDFHCSVRNAFDAAKIQVKGDF
jgi:hypothetical protein